MQGCQLETMAQRDLPRKTAGFPGNQMDRNYTVYNLDVIATRNKFRWIVGTGNRE